MLNIAGLVGNTDIIYREQDVADGNIDFSFETVHLIAPTASHKSAYFEHHVNRAKAGLFIVFVPRLSLIRQMVADMRTNTDAQVFHFEDDRAEFKRKVATTEHEEKLVLVTTTNSLFRFESDIKLWMETERHISAVSLEEYAQGVGMWENMKGATGVKNFRILQQIIAVADTVVIPDGTEAEFVKTWVDGLRPASKSIVMSIDPIHAKAPVKAYYGKMGEALAYVRNRIIQQTGRIAVGFDTAKQLNIVLKELRAYNAENPDSAIPYVVSVAPDNKSVQLNDEELANMAAFEADVNGEAPKYTAYLYTTKLGTGVSITAVEVETRIVIAGNTTSPADHLQMINRFRRHTENIVLFVGANNAQELETTIQRNTAIANGANKFRNNFGIGETRMKKELDEHIYAYHEWVAQLKEGGINTLLDMLERDGMLCTEVSRLVVNEPLITRVAKMDVEEATRLAALMIPPLKPIPPKLKDRELIDLSEYTAEEIEIMRFWGMLYMLFSPNLVNENLVQCIMDFGKRVNAESSLFVGEVIMGIRTNYADKVQDKLYGELTANKENAQWITHQRVIVGQEVLKTLSPHNLKVRDTVYVMTPEQWQERGEAFLNWIMANTEIYNNAVGDKRNRLDEIIARHPDSRSKQAYTALKAIATVNGIVVESQQVGRGREYVPALVGLDRRWTMFNGRVLGKEATLKALQQGLIPSDTIIPAINLDWCKLADELWLQIDSIKSLVDRKNVETLNIYQAWMRSGATENTARKQYKVFGLLKKNSRLTGNSSSQTGRKTIGKNIGSLFNLRVRLDKCTCFCTSDYIFEIQK